MARNESYHTKQKNLILEVIVKQKHEFTIKDIYHEIQNQVGLTTIYRFVERLVNDGRLKKFIGKDNITYYQYLEICDKENHFYLKCEKCGKMVHVDCNCIKDLSKHISKNHKFILSQKTIIINGLCEKCNN